MQKERSHLFLFIMRIGFLCVHPVHEYNMLM